MSNSLLAGATTAAATTTTTSSSSSSKTTGISSGMGQDAFLKMFMAQMTNQNPLDPMDNTEFTAQLAQFSSLEQLTEINKNLSSLTSLTDAINQSQALSFIGKEVTLSGTQLPVTSGVPGKIGFSLASAANVKVTFSNSAGKVVASRDLGAMSSGDQTYTWDGKDDYGNSVTDGIYTVKVTATDGDGNTIKVSNQTVNGLVTGYQKGSDGTTYLVSGSSWAKLSDVVGVSQSSTSSADAALASLLNSAANSDSSSSDTSSQSFADWLQSLLGGS